jgi:hypothetical protein
MIKVYAHGDGALNSLEGMAPQRLSRAHLSTPNGNLTGPLGSFWNLLRTLPQDGNNYSNGKNNGNIGSPSLGLHVINWRGDVAPVVHQLHLFSLELSGSSNKGEGSSLSVDTDADTVWEKMVATRGLIPQRQI